MRILLFTGKGGVGKTTVAAATAVRAAKAGYRTLVTSTDPAHSLADSFGVPLGDSTTGVAQNLWAEQIDAQARLEAAGPSVIPGFDGIFSLADVKRPVDGGRFDVRITACPPTAETLRLLSL